MLSGCTIQNSNASRWMNSSTPRRSTFSSSLRTQRATSAVQSPRGFYGRAEDCEVEWQPGDVIIPRASQDDAIDELKRSVHSMISDMQAALSSEFQCLQESVHALSERVHEVETQLQSQTPSSSGSEFDSPMVRRKRRIPLELQVILPLFFCE